MLKERPHVTDNSPITQNNLLFHAPLGLTQTQSQTICLQHEVTSTQTKALPYSQKAAIAD